MLRVKQVEYVRDYQIKLLFNNGKIRLVDFKEWIFEGGKLLKPLSNIDFFKKVSLDECNYSICWPNGADFSPDTLYEAGKELPNKRRAVRSKGPKRKNIVRSRAKKHLQK